MSVRLDRAESIPREFASDLDKLGDLFRGCEYLDEVLRDSRVLAIAHALHQYAEDTGILAFHYTRAFPKRLRENGLTVCSGNERRRQFMHEFGERFSVEQRTRIFRLWDKYFDKTQNSARDGRVFFAGSNDLRIVGSVGYLFGFYGGEAINMPLTEESDIMAELAQIGRPLVVCCALNPVDLRAPFDNDYGRALVSAYHVTMNNKAEWIGFSTYQKNPVLPGQIVDIHEIRGDCSLIVAST